MSEDWKAEMRRDKQAKEGRAKQAIEAEKEDERLRVEFSNKLILVEGHIHTVMKETGEAMREQYGEDYIYEITTPTADGDDYIYEITTPTAVGDDRHVHRPLAEMVVTKDLSPDKKAEYFRIRYDGNLIQHCIDIVYGVYGTLREKNEVIEGDNIDIENIAAFKNLARKPILDAIKLFMP